MNRGHVLPVQQMVAAGNPNSWWNMINTMRQPPQQFHHQHHQHHQQASPFLPPHPSNLFPQYAPPAPNSSSSQLPFHLFYDNQELHHESLSQLLMSGFVGEDLDHKGGITGMNHFHEAQAEKKINNNWEEQVMHQHQASNNVVDDHVKQEHNMFGQHANHEDDQFQQQQQVAAANKSIWSPVILVSNSPNSCVTTANSNMMNFSGKNDGRHPPPDRSSESNSSTSSGGALKKARVQPSTTQSASTTVKVRKEKLGDRITALHQLVSPFGKTDTASVLLEAIGYIRFLQNQIEALSLPYLGSGSGNNNIRQQQQQQSVQGERNCIFPEDPGQLLNDNCLKRKGASHDNMGSHEEAKKDLRSKGLCLVPVSCTLQVGSDNGADYWAPAMGGGGFR